MIWRNYWITPYLDLDDPDVPGWKIFMIEGNGGWATLQGAGTTSWLIEAYLTEAQHDVMIAHPSVTFDGLGRSE